MAAALAAISATLTYAIQARLYALHAFDEYDLFFDADSVAYLRIFTAGPTRLDPRHPALPLFGHVPVVAASWLVGGAVPYPVLVLGLVAVIAALRTLLLFSVFRRVADRLLVAGLVCTVDIVAASTVTVGGIPESYVFSAACVTAMFWLVARERASPSSWLLVATIAIGVTVTNAIAVAVLAVTALRGQGVSLRRAGAIAVGLIGLALLIDGAVAAGMAAYFDSPVLFADPVHRFVHRPRLNDAAELAWAIGHTLLAPAATSTPYASITHPQATFIFGYGPSFVHGWGSLWRAAATALLVGLGGWAAACHARYRQLYAAGALVTVANASLLLVYGRRYFLYTPHWEPALVVMVAGAALLPGRLRPLGTAALAVFAVLTAASTANILGDLFAYFAAVR